MAARTAPPSSTRRAAPARGPAAGARPPGPKARLLGPHGLTLLPVGGGWLLGQLGQLGQPLLAQLPETRLPHPATPLQPIHQRLRDGQVAVPLAVGRDDRPGGLGGAATVQGLLVGDGVVLPAVAFLPVVGGELVGLLDVLFAGEQPLALLLLGDVQEELADDGAAVDQQPLEVVDLLVTLLLDLAGVELVDAHDQDVLVVGPVEDADHAVGGVRRWTRQRKSWSSSTSLGALNEVTWQPCGLTLEKTLRMVPSLPLVSMPWSTTRRLWTLAA